jgi:hypothetical protein
MATKNINPTVDLVKAEDQSNSHIQHVWNVGPGVDATNEVTKTAEIVTDGTPISGANGATLTGVGVLKRLMLYNGSGSAVTVEVYDNTSAAGTKLTTTIPIPTLGFHNLELNKPYALGVYIAWSTATSCQALGSSQAVA